MAPGSAQRLLASRWAPILVLGLGLLVQAGILVHLSDRLWFFGDDWDFLLRRGLTSDPELSLLEPHNEHWSTVPIVLFRCLFVVFGLEHYLPYALMPIVAHVLVCVLLFVLLRSARVSPWVAVLTTLVVAFLAGGAGAENTLWDFQIGFLGACVFGLVALVAVDRERRWSLPVAAVALVLGLMSAGIGLVMLFWAGLLTLLRHGPRRAGLVVVVPTAVYAVWYLGYGRAVHGVPPVPSAAPAAAMKGLGNVWSDALAMPGAGAAMLLALVAAVVLPRHGQRLFTLAASGLAALFVAYALFGYTRSGFGEGATMAERYLYFGIVFSAPALGAGFDVLARRLRGRSWAQPAGWAVAATVAGALGVAHAVQFADARVQTIGALQERVVAATQVVSSGQRLLGEFAEPQLNPDIQVPALRDAEVRDSLPKVQVDAQALLDARGVLQVDVREAAFDLPFAPEVAWIGFGRQAAGVEQLSGCTSRVAEAGARLEFAVSRAPRQLAVAASGEVLNTQLSVGGRTSVARPWPIQAGAAVHVGVSAEQTTVRILLEPGPVTVCGRP
ncbi:hypothetical protein [Nocardioides pantholopis]|uniref:hypothetical protein n=1 Tax=Nocardioides pantholopis TaxID=2483798 RepID=UPI000F07E7CC|nr:hypothetical protein [Nocardioides pantholopis]